jgi:hypothetical protein
MFVKYNPKNPHVKTIPVVVKSGGDKAIPLANNSVILRPGANELTEQEWTAIQPHVQDEIKQKIIVPFTVPVKKAGGIAKAKTLKDAPVSVARKIIESCQNVADLKKWARQEIPDEIMLLVLKRLRKLKIDPDEFGDDLTDEDAPDEDITPEGDGAAEPESGAKATEDDGGGEGEAAAAIGKRSGKKGAGGKKKPTKGGEDEHEPDKDEQETPDFDGGGGA